MQNYVTTHFHQSENTIISNTPQMPKILPEVFPTAHRPLHAKHSIAGINYNIVHNSDSILIEKRVRKKDKQKRKPRTCKQCNQSNCPLAKPGPKLPTAVCLNVL